MTTQSGTLLTLIVADLAEGQQHGIALPGEGLLYPVVLGNKGDWSYLVPLIKKTDFELFLGGSLDPICGAVL